VAQTNLSLTYLELAQAVGRFLGWGSGSEAGETAWTTIQQNIIDDCVKSGQRQFYTPPPVPGITDGTYRWSFLSPAGAVTFSDGQREVPMPEDMGGLEGRLTFSGGDEFRTPIDLVNDGILRAKYAATPDAEGPPECAAVVVKKLEAGGQRKHLFVYPEPDDDYTLEFNYYLLPEAVSGDRPYAYGGPAHAETILESCLAIAEERVNDQRGLHHAKFLERLAASVAIDKASKPQSLGRMRDSSEELYEYRRWLHGQSTVTLDGETPT
jgi:hypothetical protein